MKKNKRYQDRGRKVEAQSLAAVRQLLKGQSLQRDRLIELLHLIQDHYGQISLPHMLALADEMKISMAAVIPTARPIILRIVKYLSLIALRNRERT